MSEYINIHRGPKHHVHTQRFIASNSPFFHSPVIVKQTPDGLTFEKPTLGYNGTPLSPSYIKSGWHRMTLTLAPDNDIPIGKFYFDEEDSNEDIKVIYFDQDE